MRRDGWAFWQFEHEKWGSHKVHYIEAGDPTNPRKIVLLHGFGASAYHMRWNIPHLSREFHVLCPEMLGFGWSDKPVIDYSGGEVWVDQMEAFLRDKKAEGAVVVGNSLGGYVMLALAAHHPELVSGVVLVNSAGSFKADLKQEEKQQGVRAPPYRPPLVHAGQHSLVNCA